MQVKSAVEIKKPSLGGRALTLNVDISLLLRSSHLCDQALKRLVSLLG
jgi:hypothetical protein